MGTLAVSRPGGGLSDRDPARPPRWAPADHRRPGVSATTGAAGRRLTLETEPDLVLLDLVDGDLPLALSTEVVMRGITLFGVTGRRQFETWDQTSAYLSSGRVDVSPILTHRVALSDFQLAADLAGSGEVGKVLLYPRDGGWR